MSGSKKAAKQRKKTLITIAIVALAVIAVLLAVVIFSIVRNAQNDDKDGADAGETPTTSAIKNAEELKYQKDYDQAAQQTSQQFQDSKNNNDKYLLALQTASIYETKADCKNAVEWYLKADDLKAGDRAALSGLGRCYDALGDKAKAVEYYRKTIESIDPNVSGADNDIAYYQSLLDKAEAAQ